jgi:hypothetical protein
VVIGFQSNVLQVFQYNCLTPFELPLDFTLDGLFAGLALEDAGPKAVISKTCSVLLSVLEQPRVDKPRTGPCLFAS